MEFTSLVDTSLDLKFRPLPLVDKVPKQEAERSNMSGLGGRDMPANYEAGQLLVELHRVNTENKKLTEMLTVVCENYNALRKQLMEYTGSNQNNDGGGCRKRKAESPTTPVVNGRSESSSSEEESHCKKPREEHINTKISTVSVKTQASDATLILKDGYQWRKYGQKVTRDNPCPRAYFKCSFAPSCPVKKKVQRSIEDQSILVATYEGEHNHPQPSIQEAGAASTSSTSSRLNVKTTVPSSTIQNPSGQTITLDLTEPKTVATGDTRKMSSSTSPTSGRTAEGEYHGRPVFQHFLIEQMASSLTKDPSFKAALAAAISGKILQHNNQTSNW